MVQRLLPETRRYRSVSAFRNPFSRVCSLYSYTSQLLDIETSLDGFDNWVRHVFCNPFNEMWRAHGLQVDRFFDQTARPCVDRVYAGERLRDLADFLIPGSGSDLPHLNRSSLQPAVSDLRPSTQAILCDAIRRDLDFWDELSQAGGCLIFR